MAEEEQKVEEPQKDSQDSTDIISMLSMAAEKSNLRIIGLYGDINEERCAEAIYSLLTLSQETVALTGDDLVDLEQPPIEFYISTYGGQSAEMFSVYDVMRMAREDVPIYTYGLGKVMSAGVLLLAAGTKGQRRIGKNCRVMIHGVISGQHGHIADVENEFSEAKMTQKLYVAALAKETTMTEKDIRKMINKKTNVYIDAEKAVELGIADIIF